MHRPEAWKLRECGGKMLSALPSSMQVAAPALAELPQVMASFDGIVYNNLTGEMLKAVKAKHHCPFVPSAGQAFFSKGDRVLALEDMPLEYFTQCQMQMLVQDLPHCDLISYALSGSRVFTIPRDEQWLVLALHLLAHLQKEYIQAGRVPETDTYSREVPRLFSAFMARTKHCMAELQRKPRLNVPSSVDKSACQMFLDDLPSSDQRRRQIGGYSFRQCSIHRSKTHCCAYAEELLNARAYEPAQDVPATPFAVEPVEVASEQPDGGQTPAEHEDSQALSAVMPQAEMQQPVSASEEQPMEAQPAGRPRRTLKRPMKFLERFESSGQEVSCPPQSLLHSFCCLDPSLAAVALLELRFPAGSARAISELTKQEAEKDTCTGHSTT